MKVTFLGHQSWLCQSGADAFLVDPILGDRLGTFSSGGGLELRPRRTLHLDQFPPLGAVLLSHGHEDHFDVPSLRRIDERVPVLVPETISSACLDALRMLDRKVTRFRPGQVLRIGSMEVHTFPPNHFYADWIDEWDTVALAVRPRGGSGFFFTNVDIGIDARISGALTWPGPGVAFVEGGVMAMPARGREAWNDLKRDEFRRIPAHDRPRAVTRRAGPVKVVPGINVEWSGEGCHIRGHANPLVEIAAEEREAQQIWLHPGEGEFPSLVRPDRLSAKGKASLGARLDELARFLYGRSLFKLLMSLGQAELGQRSRRVGMLARDRGGLRPYEYRPESSTFVLVSPAESEKWIGALEMWGVDLLAVLENRVSSRVAGMGFYREHWHLETVGAPEFLFDVIHPFVHALHRPEWMRAEYARLVDRHPARRELGWRRSTPVRVVSGS